MRRLKNTAKLFVFSVAVVVAAPAIVRAQAALLLEEPYSYDGTFAGTGHAAVYLSRVCAETPTLLRRCQPGETGVVISRYHGIAGRDWIAVPLIPYLYAVSKPEEIPLFADAKLVSFLRSSYLQTLLLPSEANPGAEPRYQLAGSAYDRSTYGFRVATRPEQDDALIKVLNSAPNKESYKLLDRNCADFARQIINFYYPRAIHRSVIGDLGVMTPKQAAKTLVHFSKHHPETQLTTFIIPQVPGRKRSRPVRGVIESLVLAKKYVTPVLLFHPFVVGSVEVAYWTGWRFDPAKDALIFDPNSPDLRTALEMPLNNMERRSYEGLVLSAKKASDESGELPSWRRVEGHAEPELDAAGRPFLRVQVDGRTTQLGLCRGNMLQLSAPPELVEDLVLARLQDELKAGKPARTSVPQVKRDWNLLIAAREAREAEATPARALVNGQDGPH
jgi:hypothetical protein